MTTDLQAYKNLSDRNKMLFMLSHSDRPVYIYSGQHCAYWRDNRSGYSLDVKGAGVYTFEEALAVTEHCSKEKKITFHFIGETSTAANVFEAEDIFNDVHVRFDKYKGGIGRADSPRRMS